MSRDTSPFRYTKWLALDLIRVQLALFAIVSIVLPIVIYRMTRGFGTAPDPATILKGTFLAGLTIATLMAIGGSIGTDLASGFYRAWFSKPMAPAWYYFQRWFLAGVAVVLAPFMLGGMLALVLGKGSGLSVDLIATVALGYFLIGSACLLFSNFTSKDWLVVFLLSFLQQRLAEVIQQSAKVGFELPQWMVLVKKALPPFHLINPMKPPLHGNELLHVLGYGIAMLVAALVIVQVRPLGSGGRA